MTVNELKEILEDLDGNAEVRIAYQPNYPLQVSVACVTDLSGASPQGTCVDCGGYRDAAQARDELREDFDDDALCECDDDVNDENRVVWIATGSPTASGYAPRAAWKGEE